MIGHVSYINIEPVLVEWNIKRPYNADVDVWRKDQVKRYVELFPNNKPKAVLEWL